MVETGDQAPTFTAPLATGDIEQFVLEDAVVDGPIVLAFFPGAFTSVCQAEMNAFNDRLSEFEEIGARVVGISRDSPFSLNEFRDQNDLDFDLVSDFNGAIIDQYGVAMDFADIGVYDLAKRAVFVLNSDGAITYAWVSDDPGVEPDYDEVLAAAENTD